MGIKTFFAILAFLFSASAYVFYVKSVLGSSSRPTLSSWISWGLMDAAILGGMVAAGEMAWQLVAYVAGVGCVIGASIYKKATVDWKRLDSYCLVIVICAIVLWTISGNPNVAIVLSLVAITIGSIPLTVNLWRDPSREPRLPWLLILAGGVFGVLAIREWNIAAALTPVWFLLIMVFFVFLMFRTPHSCKAA